MDMPVATSCTFVFKQCFFIKAFCSTDKPIQQKVTIFVTKYKNMFANY